MDAQQSKPEIRQHTRPLLARLAVSWLALLLAVGLWQGYGRWFLRMGGVDAF
jgi:hypothetical protein